MKQASEKIVVYTYGVYDLFHRGHLELLTDAKKLGDYLIVGIFSDDIAESFKRKPIITLQDRLEIIRHCKIVDDVVVQYELHPGKNLKKYKPHILAKGPGAGWSEKGKIPGEDMAQKLNIKIIRLNYHSGISTSEIIKKIKNI